MMAFLALMAIIIVYAVCPVWLEVVLFLVNVFVPDVIPIADELVMLLITSSKAGLLSS